jgi:hypothetical protein
MTPRRLAGIACAALALALLAGCGTLGVKPWQRDLLARREMTPGANAVQDSIDEHIYFSKEAASGGRGFGGGGCGCN